MIQIACAFVLLALTFRSGGLIDEYQTRAFSAPSEWLRNQGYLLSAVSLITVSLIFVVAIPSGRLVAAPTLLYFYIAFLLFTRLRLVESSDGIKNIWLSIGLGSIVIAFFGVLLPSAIRSGVISAKQLVLSIPLGALFWSVISLYEYWRNGANAEWQGRFLGISGHPNHAGFICAIGAIAVIGFLLRSRVKYARLLLSLILMLFLYLLYWTGSRGAIVMLVVGISAQIFERRITMIISVLVVILSLLFVLGKYDMTQFENAVDSRIVSGENTRLEAWESLWTSFVSNPIIGVGDGVAYTENSYLLTLARTGVFGMVPFSIFWGMVLLRSYRMLGRDEPGAVTYRIVGSLLLALLISGLFEGVLKDELSFVIFSAYFLVAVPEISVPYGIRGPSSRHYRSQISKAMPS